MQNPVMNGEWFSYVDGSPCFKNTSTRTHPWNLCPPRVPPSLTVSLLSLDSFLGGGGGVSVPFSGETPLNRTALVNAPESVARLYRTVGSKPPTWGGAGCAYGCEMDL